MKHTIMFALVGLLAITGCAAQQEAEPAADPSVTLNVEPEALSVGETMLVITITDGSGQPIDGAALTIHGNMDHAGMTPIERQHSDSTSGEYRVPIEWSMGGGWLVTVTARLPDEQGTINKTFEFFVEAASSNSIINGTQPASSGG